MKRDFLKLAGVKTEKEFYQKYPTEQHFFAAHPQAAHLKFGGTPEAFPQQPTDAQFFNPGFIPTAPKGFYMGGGNTPFPTQPTMDQFFNPGYIPTSPVGFYQMGGSNVVSNSGSGVQSVNRKKPAPAGWTSKMYKGLDQFSKLAYDNQFEPPVDASQSFTATQNALPYTAQPGDLPGEEYNVNHRYGPDIIGYNPDGSPIYRKFDQANDTPDNQQVFYPNPKGTQFTGNKGLPQGPNSSKGDDSTRALQKQLNMMGANLAVDGIMGPKTRAAMTKYMSPASAQHASFIKTYTNPGTGESLNEAEGKAKGWPETWASNMPTGYKYGGQPCYDCGGPHMQTGGTPPADPNYYGQRQPIVPIPNPANPNQHAAQFYNDQNVATVRKDAQGNIIYMNNVPQQTSVVQKQSGGPLNYGQFPAFQEGGPNDHENDDDMDDVGMMKKGGWMKNAVNPDHKGYCTPMTKPTCTGHRRAFAEMMKKKHGFHKKQQGGAAEQGSTIDKTVNGNSKYFKNFIANNAMKALIDEEAGNIDQHVAKYGMETFQTGGVPPIGPTSNGYTQEQQPGWSQNYMQPQYAQQYGAAPYLFPGNYSPNYQQTTNYMPGAGSFLPQGFNPQNVTNMNMDYRGRLFGPGARKMTASWDQWVPGAGQQNMQQYPQQGYPQQNPMYPQQNQGNFGNDLRNAFSDLFKNKSHQNQPQRNNQTPTNYAGNMTQPMPQQPYQPSYDGMTQLYRPMIDSHRQSFQQGGTYELNQDQINQIIQAGGEIEYID